MKKVRPQLLNATYEYRGVHFIVKRRTHGKWYSVIQSTGTAGLGFRHTIPTPDSGPTHHDAKANTVVAIDRAFQRYYFPEGETS